MNAHTLVCRAPLHLAAKEPVVSSTAAEPKLAGQASAAARARCAELSAEERRRNKCQLHLLASLAYDLHRKGNHWKMGHSRVAAL